MSFIDNPALQAMKQQMDAKKDIITGTVKFTRQSFGFIEEVEGERTIFTPPPIMKNLLPGDVVEIVVGKEDDREFVEEVRKLVSSELETMIGRVKVTERDGKVRKHFISNNPTFTERMPIFGDLYRSLNDGDWIEVEVTQHALEGRMFKVNPLRVLGNESDAEFPWKLAKLTIAVNSQIKTLAYPKTGSHNRTNYDDRTAVPYVTIDGESTQDMDDALYAEDRGDTYFLSVAIANPSELLEASDEQFRTILERAFSFYLPKETIHMLPRDLAVGRYSLVQGEDRPTLCLDVELSKDKMEIISGKFVLAHIHSEAKLSYSQVNEFIANPTDSVVWGQSVLTLSQLAPQLREKRAERQSLFDDRADYSFVFDGFEPVDLVVKLPTLADYIVEEAMILANEYMGRFAEENGINVIYNTNAGFKAESLETIQEILEEINLPMSNEEIFEMAGVTAIQKRLKADIAEAKDSGDTKAILLAENRFGRLRGCFERSVFKSVAEPQKVMGAERYVTWTSPLRKVGDLITHLNVINWLMGKEQIEITEEMLEVINSQNDNARSSERTVSKMLYTKLFRNNPSLIKTGKVRRVGKTGCLVELTDLGTYTSMPLRNVRFKSRPEIDLDAGAIMVNGEPVITEGDTINIKFLQSELLYNDIHVTLDH